MNNENIYELLSQIIFDNDSFIKDYKNLILKESIDSSIELSPEACKRLLESAAIMACSDSDNHRIISLNISSKIIELCNNDFLRSIAEFILTRLGNFPLLIMSKNEFNIPDYFNILGDKYSISLPSKLKGEVILKKSFNKITIGNELIYLTDFQSRVMNNLKKGKNISIAAPTSAGKSYILLKYITNFIKKNNKKFIIIYIVPTRALISQVQRDLKWELEKYSMKDIQVHSSSNYAIEIQKHKSARAILVLTPERLQIIRSNINKLSVDLLIVDETQKIEEGSRGITLEECVQQVVDLNPISQYIFISPFARNIEELNLIFTNIDIYPIITRFSPVSQNIIRIDIEKNRLDISYISKELNRIISLSSRDIDDIIPKEQYKRKAWVVLNVLTKGPTMVYCNRPTDCRKTADEISKMLDFDQIDPEILEVINFIEKYIHPQYHLINYLRKGVAFHYGSMPSSIRMAVESLFSNKYLDTLCCTSTLMEGVNLAAKNIVVYKPRSGMASPMKDIEFYNLGGRAGRLMKDFCGNIYCIDIDEWDEEGYHPNAEETNHELKSSMRKVLLEKREAIVKHLKHYKSSLKGQDDVEAAVTRFIINEIGRGNKEFAAQLLKRESKLTKEDLDEMVVLAKEIAEKITLPANVILKNISIDPRLQDILYLKLSKMVDPPVLIHPSSPEFSDKLYKVLLLINICFKRNYEEERILNLTKLTDLWLKETTLKKIIELELDNKRLSGEDINSKEVINNTIESIIKDINNILGYEFCRDINCYEDILSYVMKKRNKEFKKTENLSYYIEVGAHKPITIDLLNKGIPRIIALIISSRLPADSYNEENYKKALQDAKREIPSILFEEIFTKEMQFHLSC